MGFASTVGFTDRDVFADREVLTDPSKSTTAAPEATDMEGLADWGMAGARGSASAGELADTAGLPSAGLFTDGEGLAD